MYITRRNKIKNFRLHQRRLFKFSWKFQIYSKSKLKQFFFKFNFYRKIISDSSIFFVASREARWDGWNELSFFATHDKASKGCAQTSNTQKPNFINLIGITVTQWWASARWLSCCWCSLFISFYKKAQSNIIMTN